MLLSFIASCHQLGQHKNVIFVSPTPSLPLTLRACVFVPFQQTRHQKISFFHFKLYSLFALFRNLPGWT